MIHTINEQPYANFDKFVDIKSLNEVKEATCLAFARNFNRLMPATAGDPENWPDGSEPFIPKSPYRELSDALKDHATNKDSPLWPNANALGKENFPLGYAFMSLVTDSVGIGTCMMLRYMKSTKYADKSKAEGTAWTPWATEFEPILSWVNKQNIFKEQGRIIIFYNGEGQGCGLHRDHSPNKRPQTPDQFIWINLFPDRKQFYLLDGQTGEKHYCRSQTAMFDTSNWHASDSHPLPAFSLRVDGRFTDEWLEKTNLKSIYSSS